MYIDDISRINYRVRNCCHLVDIVIWFDLWFGFKWFGFDYISCDSIRDLPITDARTSFTVFMRTTNTPRGQINWNYSEAANLVQRRLFKTYQQSTNQLPLMNVIVKFKSVSMVVCHVSNFIHWCSSFSMGATTGGSGGPSPLTTAHARHAVPSNSCWSH